jgi:hypothetical protein
VEFTIFYQVAEHHLFKGVKIMEMEVGPASLKESRFISKLFAAASSGSPGRVIDTMPHQLVEAPCPAFIGMRYGK